MKALLQKIRQILRDRRTRRLFTRFVSGIAAVIVFVTTYALVLPAITMEAAAGCGLEAHQHDDSCYEDQLVCGQEESDGHTHTADCYDEEGNLICGIEESAGTTIRTPAMKGSLSAERKHIRTVPTATATMEMYNRLRRRTPAM